MVKKEFQLEYNTERDIMIIAEYGRNVQKMVNYLVTIEERDERTAFAKEVVKTMGRVTLEKDEFELYQNKLWDHLFLMSGGELDIDFPFEKPSIDEIMSKPNKLEYSKTRIRYRMYGANIQRMIEAALLMEEGEEREDMLFVIANAMKRSYIAWNKTLVGDEVIFQHLTELSKGQITLDEKVIKLKSAHYIHAQIKKHNIEASGRSIKNYKKSKTSKSKKKIKKK